MGTQTARLAELIQISLRLKEELNALAPLLDDPEVNKAVRFLAELDALAEEYGFTSSEIVLLIDPSRARQLTEGRLPPSVENEGDDASADAPASPPESRGEEGKQVSG